MGISAQQAFLADIWDYHMGEDAEAEPRFRRPFPPGLFMRSRRLENKRAHKPLVAPPAGLEVLSPSSSPFRADFLGGPKLGGAEFDDIGLDIDSAN